jgi:peptide deformylase
MEILKYPHPILRQVAKPVEVFDEKLKQLADDMIKTMHINMGVGLAAPQVGHSIRLIVMDVSQDRNQPLILINPVIKVREGKQTFEEGCLSFPGIYSNLSSAEQINVEFQTVTGDIVSSIFGGTSAVCIQHEIDHLDGKLFLDRMNKKDRIKIKTKAMGGK